MGTRDITVSVADGKFNYRVGAIIIDSGEILMVKNSGASFYYTVGGRIQFGESAYEAILREAFEETQIQLEVDKLAYIHENFFTMNSNGEIYHELCFFFLLKPNSLLREMKHDTFKEEYGDVSYHWIPLDKLKDFHMYPEFFKTELLNLSDETKYFVTRNEVTTLIM
jgi:8-oxo-dGTP pyrophosphatase MutT (NUDIX family)